MSSNEKVVLCGITFDKENAPDLWGAGYPNLGFLRRMEDGTFYGTNIDSCIEALVYIDDYVKDGDIFIDFNNKEVWIYISDKVYGGSWNGPNDSAHGGSFIAIEEYRNRG